MSLRDNKGWNVFHHALYNNRPVFIEKIIAKAKEPKSKDRVKKLAKQKKVLLELDDLTDADQSPLMLQGPYLTVDTFQLLYNQGLGLTHVDDLRQNVVFYIIPGCNIDLENDQLKEQIQTSHIDIVKGIINSSEHFK